MPGMKGSIVVEHERRYLFAGKLVSELRVLDIAGDISDVTAALAAGRIS